MAIKVNNTTVISDSIDITTTGITTSSRFVSTVATGTAPVSVASSTQVTNLNSSYLEGYITDTANTPNRIVRRDASGNFSAGTITASLSGNATGLSGSPNITVGTITATVGTIGSNGVGTRTIQSGGTASGGSSGDIYYIY